MPNPNINLVPAHALALSSTRAPEITFMKLKYQYIFKAPCILSFMPQQWFFFLFYTELHPSCWGLQQSKTVSGIDGSLLWGKHMCESADTCRKSIAHVRSDIDTCGAYIHTPDGVNLKWKTTCLTGVDRLWQTQWTLHSSLSEPDRMFGLQATALQNNGKSGWQFRTVLL